jgi:hypothetical protein
VTEWNEEPNRPPKLQLLRPYCLALRFIEYPEGGPNPNLIWGGIQMWGASAFLWQSRNSRFIVTAFHVWNEFRKQARRLRGRCMICGLDDSQVVPLFPIKAISEDADLDLAVLTVANIEKLEFSRQAFFSQPSNSGSKVSTGDSLEIVAYSNSAHSPENIGILYRRGEATVSSTGTTIRVVGDPPHKFYNPAVPSPTNSDFAGASGAPVFTVRPSGEVEWVGIIREDGGPPHYDVIITPSRFIGEDGIITRPPELLGS